MLDSDELGEENILAALMGISEMMGDLTDPDEFMESVVRIVPRLTGVSRCAVVLRSTEAEEFRAAHAFAHDPAETRKFLHLMIREREAPGLVRRIMQQRIPVMVRVGREHVLPPDVVETYGIRSILLVPIAYQDQVLGFLALDEPGRDHVFTSRDVNVVTAIAYHLAIAIVHTRLAESSRSERRRSEALASALCDGLVLVDERMRVTSLNPGAEALLGWRSDELAGTSWADLVEWREHDGLFGAAVSFSAWIGGRAAVVRLRTRDRRGVTCLVMSAAVPSPSGGSETVFALTRVTAPDSGLHVAGEHEQVDLSGGEPRAALQGPRVPRPE